MNKIRVSLRLDADLVKRIDSKKTKTRTRNDVVTDLILLAIDAQSQHSKIPDNDRSKQLESQANLLAKGAKASVMLLKMAELALRRHSDQANEIINKTQTHYQDEIKALISEAQLEIV